MNANFKTWTIRNGTPALCILLIAGAGVGTLTTLAAPRAASARMSPAIPTSIQLTATIRDFKARELSGGHTDFEWQPTDGFGHYIGEVADTLDARGLPVFNSSGYKVDREWKNSSGRNIMNPHGHITGKPGDAAGAAQSSPGGAIHTSASFAQWYRDVSGVNQSIDIPITMKYDAATSSYVFDDRTDPDYAMLGGFFPIDDKLMGNYGATGHNYGFTAMIETQFVYEKNAGYMFTFRGDDDVWVFVDGKLSIDLGGVHGGTDQSIELDRLNWLIDGKTYSLRFFFAERHTSQSNFRIESNFVLQDVNSHHRPAIKGWEEVEPRNE
jgi:fibro-slime domain-containing protein